MTTQQSTPALTSIYTPPASCLPQAQTVFTRCVLDNGDDLFFCPTDPGPGCATLAPVTDPAVTYSPGCCPSGYAATGAFAQGGETMQMCCPSGFQTYTPSGGSRAFCASTYAGGVSLDAFDPASSLTLATASGASQLGFAALVNPVNIAWQSSDLDRFTPRSAPVLLQTPTASYYSSLPTQQPSTTTSSATTTPRGSSPSFISGGLSTGAEAGIGVGVSIAIISIISLAVWFLLRRRRKHRQTEQPMYVDDKAELPIQSAKQEARLDSPELGNEGDVFEAANTQVPAEVEHDGGRHELGGDGGRPAELQAQSPRLEMDSRFRGHEVGGAPGPPGSGRVQLE